MDELVDILDSEGNFTGKTALKSEAHTQGLPHPTVHIWFYTANGMILLQKRSQNKDTHPLYWDVSVAGHVGAGEDLETAVIRETYEEIGLEISRTDIEKIGIFKSLHTHHSKLIDHEFNHTYLCKLKTPIELLKKQKSEVADLRLLTLSAFTQIVEGSNLEFKLVPHEEEYRALIEAVKKRL